MKKRFEKVTCRYEFSEDEKKEIAMNMAIEVQKKNQLEEDKKETAAQYKEQITTCENRSRVKANQIEKGYELRPVECEIVFDYENSMIRWVRTDTGAEAKTKPMSEEQKQMKLGGEI